MKKTLVTVLGMAMIAPMAWAQTNVLSQNAVGYVKLTIPANGGLVLARHDFNNIDGSPTVLTDVLGLDLADGTTVFKWDRALQQYVVPAPTLSTDFLGNKAWSRTDIQIVRGDSFFILNGNPAPATDVYLLGEVPGANNNSETTLVSPAEGFTGFPYPAATTLTGTAMADAVPVDTTVFIWDTTSGGYILPGPTKSQDFLGNISWTADPIIPPGIGFFVSAGGANVDATEVKPYAWP